MDVFPAFWKRNSGEIARKRLKLLLVADKANCSPEMVEMIKDDMAHVVSRYMEIDSQGIEIQMTQMKPFGHQDAIPALYANIPIRDIPNKGTY